MVRVFSRCSSPHYFEGSHCSLDGWSSPASEEIAVAMDQLLESGTRPSIEALRELGVSDNAISRCIVVELGSDSQWQTEGLIDVRLVVRHEPPP